MNVFLQLIKITTSSVEPSTNEKMKSKVFAIVMSVIIVFLIFIPVSFFVGFLVYALTNGLVTLGTEASVASGLSLMLHIIAIFSAIFGFNVVMSVFYFSSDLEYLLPLPISPMKIVGAKLTATMLSENVMECILVFSSLVGFMAGYGLNPPVGSGINIVSIISAIIGVATFPILPISYCAIICMVVMYFSKFLKNKDRVSKITAFSTIIILLVLVFCLNLANGFDTNLFVEQLINNDITLVNVLDKIFFSVPLLSSAVAGSFVSLLLYILVNAACIGVVLLLASKLYFKAVISLNGGQGSAKERTDSINYDKKIKSHSHLFAYFKKELLILARTPAYLSNCLGINLIWPIFIYLFIVLQKQNDLLGGYIEKLQYADPSSVLNLSLLVFGISVILTSLNCLASSAITREGRHFEVMKYMPVDLMTQINSKALVSIVISGVGLIIYIITAFIVFGISPMLMGYCVGLSILAVIFTTYLGIYIDTMNPKLVWEDEVNALRGNYHVFFNMGLELVITAVMCAVMRLLFLMEFLPVALLQSLLLLASAMMCYAFYSLCKNKGVKNLMKIEM